MSNRPNSDRILWSLYNSLFTNSCLINLLPSSESTFVTGKDFHYLLLWFMSPVSLFALLLGYFQRRDKMALLLGAIGLSQLTIAAIVRNEFFNELS
jgi:hypothetical protein